MVPNKFGIIRQNGNSFSTESNLYAVNFDPIGNGFAQIATRKPEIIMPTSYEISKRFQENASTRVVTTASDFSSIAAVYDLTYVKAVLVPICALPGANDKTTPTVSALVDENNKAVASIMLKLSSVDDTEPMYAGYAFFDTKGANKLLVTHIGVGTMTEDYIEGYIRNNPVIAFKYR